MEMVQTTAQLSMKDRIVASRMEEMAVRERILLDLRALNLGARATKIFCETELAYTQIETRQLMTTLGLILTGDALTSADPVVRLKIEKLKNWRRLRARDQGVPPYRVLTNRVLLAMASKCPKTSESLQELKGFGRKSAEAYGRELLDLLHDSNF